jgi:hypothetical protein
MSFHYSVTPDYSQIDVLQHTHSWSVLLQYSCPNNWSRYSACYQYTSCAWRMGLIPTDYDSIQMWFWFFIIISGI